MCTTDFYACDSPISDLDYSTLNGYLRIRAINPIVGQIPGQVIEVLVFASAAENMKFAAPTDVLVFEGDPAVLGQDVVKVTQLQSATIADVDQSVIQHTLIPSSGDYPMADILAGEDIRSLRALLQKPSPVYVHGGIWITGANHLDLPHNCTEGTRQNFMDYFGSMYLAFAGSIRYKYIIDLGTDASAGNGLSTNQSTPAICDSNSAHASLPLGEFVPVVNGDMISGEYLCPFYFNEKFVPAYKLIDYPNDQFIWDLPTEDPITFRMLMYRSMGPDARLTSFRCHGAFVFIDEPETSVTTSSTVTLNAGGMFAHAEAKTAQSNEAKNIKKGNRLSDQQYRARTGRTVRRTNSRVSREFKLKQPPSQLVSSDGSVAVPLSSGHGVSPLQVT